MHLLPSRNLWGSVFALWVFLDGLVYKDYSILGCGTVYVGRKVPDFWKNLLFLFSRYHDSTHHFHYQENLKFHELLRIFLKREPNVRNICGPGPLVHDVINIDY